MDNYSVLIFCACNLINVYCLHMCKIRPTHEQTTILLDQLQKHFLVISHVPGGGGGRCTIIEMICRL